VGSFNWYNRFLPVTTCNYATLLVLLLPSYDVVIPPVSNKHSVIVIHNETERPRELLKVVPLSTTILNSDPVLCITCMMCD
jgi:uncharacterized protein YifN (PemK superfamily)